MTEIVLETQVLSHHDGNVTAVDRVDK